LWQPLGGFSRQGIGALFSLFVPGFHNTWEIVSTWLADTSIKGQPTTKPALDEKQLKPTAIAAA
jgi:hypothetical protein